MKIFSQRLKLFFTNKNVILILLLILSLSLRLYFVFVNKNIIVECDQRTYDDLALSLLNEHQYAVNGKTTAYVTPLYPIFLSIIYFFFGHSYFVVRIIQTFLGFLVCLITYFIAKEIFNKSVALVVLFLMAIHNFFIVFTRLLMSENLFIFLVALSILFLVKFSKKPTYFSASLFGLFSSLATLTRSAHFLFIFMVIVFLSLRPNIVNAVYKKLLRFFVLMLLCFIIPVSIWTIRNYLVFKRFIPLGTEAGIILYAAYNPPQGKILDSSVRDDVTAAASKLPEFEYGQSLLKHAFLSIKKDPKKIYKYIPLKLMYFFSIFDWVVFGDSGVYNFSFAFILPLAFLGIILLFRKKYPDIKLILLFPLIYYLFITITIWGVPRTRFPIEPYLIIFTALFISHIYSRIRIKGLFVGILSFWYFFNYYLYLNSSQAKEIFKLFFQKIGLW